ncbi:sodium-coupled monocarboxylate transporter 1-like isoform X2 [Diorhabda carinulata]|uniref:sodium-coupled monocarboxylate transporter 1-like isoform X2 n=1 Tax=Diorhabda carinulata TaxID=1163345 RepID=UPI0025A26679|nr:sodium-coupled monocarboxylate transporter 1-like isoform X2 [Diorhabda carinulata]XP_057665818.1 sodium-coupled monocarboxylate transporter 1-like isoform X2 [Diorhabda carinulata]
MLEVTDVGSSMQRFGWVDYVTFIGMLGISLIVGLYFGIWKKSETAQDYLVASRSMGVIPIAMSLLASSVSGISLLGIPTEVYVYGIQYIYILGGYLISALLMSFIFLPVFQDLQLTSTYEYHERRFSKTVRLFGSLLFTIKMLSWLPLVIYVPALAFNQVTGINVHLITPTVCAFCIFYTSLGGLKGVVWTDVIQLFLMFGALILVMVKGTLHAGGFETVFKRNWNSDRLEGPNFDLDPLARHTIWALVIGGAFMTVQTTGVNQNMIQRYLSLPSLKHSKRALWAFFVGITLLMGFCSYCGLLIYATYDKCDPLTTKLAKKRDQLLPLLVMEILGDFPGIPGIFVAGIFSAALSSLSTGLNAMAAIVLEDFYKPFFGNQLTEKKSFYIMKSTVICTGIVCIGLVFVVEKLGTVLQLSMSIGSIGNGPSLGVSAMGILLPWVNSKGALCGGIASLIFMCWYCLTTQSLIASGDLVFEEKPVSTEGCHYFFSPVIIQTNNITHTDEQLMIYRLSYLYYCMIGTLVAMLVGVIVSLLTKPTDPRDIDPKLLAPFIRRLITPRKFSNQPYDGITYAFGSPANGTEKQKKDITDIEMKG